jgi:hypothetical protein
MAINPSTGQTDAHHVWAVADDGSSTLVADSDPAWLAYLQDIYPTAIDGLVAEIYSNWTRFQQEYLSREAAAQAFKDADYVGDPGPWVTGFAVPSGMSNQQAADLILVQATNLKAALSQIGALRMRKYEIITATSAAVAQASYDSIIDAINMAAKSIE